eukprot:1158150-Pelagomonas_calceolata.AAC.3
MHSSITPGTEDLLQWLGGHSCKGLLFWSTMCFRPLIMPTRVVQCDDAPDTGRKTPGVAVQQLAPAQAHLGPAAAGAGLDGCRGGGGGGGDGAGGVQQWGRLESLKRGNET